MAHLLARSLAFVKASKQKILNAGTHGTEPLVHFGYLNKPSVSHRVKEKEKKKIHGEKRKKNVFGRFHNKYVIYIYIFSSSPLLSWGIEAGTLLKTGVGGRGSGRTQKRPSLVQKAKVSKKKKKSLSKDMYVV